MFEDNWPLCVQTCFGFSEAVPTTNHESELCYERRITSSDLCRKQVFTHRRVHVCSGVNPKHSECIVFELRLPRCCIYSYMAIRITGHISRPGLFVRIGPAVLERGRKFSILSRSWTLWMGTIAMEEKQG